jgi:hypothetical protein
MNHGFPELTSSFLAGQDLLYSQFNDIEFYIEDRGQEHLYFNILKKLFPKIKFEKIFPLNTKKDVKDSARLNRGNKKKIYIVDLDFDIILGKIEQIDNLFYLDRYSIENYLFARQHLYEIIRLKTPRLKNEQIDILYDYELLIRSAVKCLEELTCAFVIINKHDLGLDYYGISLPRDFDFSTGDAIYRMDFIKNYLNTVESTLKQKNGRYTLKGQIRGLKPHFRNLSTSLSTIPGKYILLFIKDRLQQLALISSQSLDSFTYSLSKEFDSSELDFLKIRIANFIK